MKVKNGVISRRLAVRALVGWDEEAKDEDIIFALNELPNVVPKKEALLKALEDVLAEIHETGVLDRHSDEIEVALAYGKVETIIEQKIAEVTENE